MYLLSTNRAELRFFGTVEEAQYEGYAILSHVWNEKEQTFAETNRIARECEETGANPRDYSSEKVRESCIIAERYGHKWIWNDACCIDKGSSSELSEAINSMFTWYARAEVCYAYLQDVSRVAHLDGSGSWSGLEGSKWFERGWTLQELLAPAEVVFLSQCWEVIGTRARLSALLEEVTMIPRGVLTLEQDIQTISVARRMSWATRRATTRLEDEAYCLMGIFDINMPVLYGEGRKAFQRLQEEIMKKTADTTLFAWSDSSILQSLSVFDILLPRDLLKADSTNSGEWCLSLLASKPGDFCESSMIDFAPNAMQILCDVTSAGQNAEVHAKSITKSGPDTTMRPSFTMTPFGIEAHLPVVRIRDFAIAVLFACRGSEQLGLFLTSRPVDTTSSSLYYACAGTNAGMWPVRMVSLSDILCEEPEHRTQVASAQWQNICFAHTPPTSMPRRSGMGILFPDEHSLSGPYYIPPRFLVPGRPLGWLEVLPLLPDMLHPSHLLLRLMAATSMWRSFSACVLPEVARRLGTLRTGLT
ncbi:HET-domain-containing protein [Lentinus brumalis]|uniref:HET-domain-containing protein n=1 Tax=Lentinus brumalis TaxID=2498619 RepID=A0A371DU39_9APHY|nr:HET-domain-containing protein [Polyporus brumalis]